MTDLIISKNETAIQFMEDIDTSYNEAIRHFTKYLTVNNLVIDPDSIRAYYEALNASNYSANTIRIRRAGAKFAIQELLDNTENMFNVEAQLKLGQVFRILNKKVKAPTIQDKIVKSEKIISKEEMSLLTNKGSSESVKAFMKFLWSSGLRVGEMVNVKLSDCKIELDTVYIKVLGKGQKERIAQVDIEPFNYARKVFKGSVYLFEHTSKPYTKRYIADRFKVVGERILNRRLHPHMFRHSYITNLRADGIDPTVIAELVGHSSTAITARYTHLTANMEDIRKATKFKDYS
jgi:site-specific recombinase XerD